MNILHALDDPHVFAPFFRGYTWNAWRVFLAALFALPMLPAQLAIYQHHTGRSTPPTQGTHEAWLVCGRRSGKSFVLATIAVFLAAFRDWRPHLGPGERATIMIIAADRRQARVVMRYITGVLRSVPMLSPLIESESQERVDLRNRVTIEVHTASFRSIRGYAIACALLDELAFWPGDDSAEPDYEVLAALRPGMATIPGAMLLCASSPYARKGALFDAHRKHFAKDGDPILLWHAPTRDMNPTVPQRVIDEAMERDPAHAAAEYLAEFRSDVESFVSREAIQTCVSVGVRERAPVTDARYFAFCDPSGGSADSFTLAIGHRTESVAVVDAVREVRPPFSPEAVVAEFCALLKSYRVSSIQGDKYAGVWPVEQFAKYEIRYEQSAKPKSDLYRDLLPQINSGQIDLLDHPRAIAQLCSLERRTARGGRDSIDHPSGQQDDLANAVAGVVASLGGTLAYDLDTDWIFGPHDEDVGLAPRALDLAEKAEYARMQLHKHIWSSGGMRPPWSY